MILRCIVGVLLSLVVPRASHAQTVALPPGFTDSLVIGDLNQPVGSNFLPDGRLLFTERSSGKVRLIVNDRIAAIDPVLVVDSLRTSDWEAGLLGIVADAGFPTRPYIYAFYNLLGVPYMRVSRYTVSGDLTFTGEGSLSADPVSRYDILLIPDVFAVHSGGALAVGADSTLYVAAGNDNFFCVSSNLSDLRGKILRLRVSTLPPGPGGPPALGVITPPDNPFASHVSPVARLVWHYGLRNPYSFHIDPSTREMFIADVGEDAFEEIDVAAEGGKNFGWEYYEAFQRTIFQPNCAQADTALFTFPVYAYAQVPTSGSAVISAGVYAPPPNAPRRFPSSYVGQYFFGDGFQQWLRRLSRTGSTWALAPAVTGQPDSLNWARASAMPWLLTSLHFGPDGALYYFIYYTVWNQPTGQLRRIAYTQPTSVNVDGVGDWTVEGRGPVRVQYAIERSATVTIDAFDVRGRRVARIERARRDPGVYTAVWSARVPRGMYTLRLITEDTTRSRRVVVH